MENSYLEYTIDEVFKSLPDYSTIYLTTPSSGAVGEWDPIPSDYSQMSIGTFVMDREDGGRGRILFRVKDAVHHDVLNPTEYVMYLNADGSVDGIWLQNSPIMSDILQMYSNKWRNTYYARSTYIVGEGHSADLNTYTGLGSYYLSTNTAFINIPADITSGHSYLVVHGANNIDNKNTRVCQVLHVFISSSDGRIYMRSVINNTWSTWVRV